MAASNEDWVKENKSPSPEEKQLAQKNKALEAEVARLSKQLGLVEAYSPGLSNNPAWVSPKAKPKVGQAIACLQLSDLHLDEVVRPEEVGGLNAYNREIAELRLRRWAAKAVELGQRYQHKWDGAIVFLGGDAVSGAIHEELRETNADVLPQTVLHWAPLLAAALTQVADLYGKVHVPCVVGNHGRLTLKMPYKRRAKNSWDNMLYELIRRELRDDKRFTFDIAEGSFLLVPIYNTHAFLSHGDEAGGGAGWSGIFTPIMTIHRKGSELARSYKKEVSYSVIGHFHQCVMAHQQGVSLNGALKGPDEYSIGHRFKPEPASQNFWIHTPEHGVTLTAPIWVADRRAEGW